MLGAWVGGRAERDAVQEAALRAATEASSALGPGTAPAAHAVAWQVRPAVLDLLRVIGLSQAAAVEALHLGGAVLAMGLVTAAGLALNLVLTHRRAVRG